jgi:predicted Zn-dependent protease
VQALVADSEAAARAAGASDDAAPLVANYDHDDDWNAAPATTSVDVFADFTPLLGRALGQAREDQRALFGFAEHIVTSTYLGTSTGLRRRFDQPTGRLELNAKTADFRSSAWDGVQTRDFVGLDVGAVVDGLMTRLDWARNRIDLPAGRYETILPPSAVADLMIDLYWSSAARDADEGRSVFSAAEGRTRVGERLSAEPLTLYSDPLADGIRCSPFEIAPTSGGGIRSVFDNGAPLQRTDWIRDGVLTDLLRTRSWAARTETQTRLPIDNLVLDGGGDASLDQLIASTERGLLLTTLWYIRTVDPQTLLLTGLTRDGVYLIEHGAVQGAVNNFRFNESPVDLLGRITEVGQTRATLPREWNDYFTRTVMPPIRVPDFNMSTVSAAS